MLTLYMREECPYCAKVRRFMADQQIEYKAVNVPRLASQRAHLNQALGVEAAQVPVLEDDGEFIADSEKILAYLRERYATTPFGEPTYGLTRTLEGVSYADAVARVKEALPSEGFGVLTEIDVQATLKKKIDVDFRPYVILGACNPKLAHGALSVELAMGLFLPCNVVVTEDDNHNAVVSAVAPRKMFELVDNEAVGEIATDVQKRLNPVLSSL